MGERAAVPLHIQMDAGQLWQTVLGDLEVRVPRTQFDNWLRSTSLVGFADDVATVAAANMFSVSTLEKRFSGAVERALSDVVGRPISVRFEVWAGGAEPAAAGSARRADTAALLGGGGGSAEATESAAPKRRERSATAAARGGEPVERGAPRGRGSEPAADARQLGLAPTPTHGLNPRYVYETYVVGSGNRFAHAASLSIAEHPGAKFNPFLVHGGVGLGKTHLLHAIGHRALELRPDLRISYVTSEKFTNDLISAIMKQRMEEFRGRYRETDILMIDDVQFIAGKESTQEEFFHTFNALYQSGKQVILTSDRPPKAISALEDRLRSRFEGGLIADVQLPDYEMRIAILRAKGEESGIVLPAEVVEYVAQKDQSNIRELEGALNKVIARSQILGEPISLALAMEALTDAAVGARRVPVTRGAVVDAVVGHYGVSTRDLRGRSRTKDIVTPRQVAMYLLREETESSLLEIGQELGGRDHTTVLHGIRQIERALTADTGLRSQVMAIREAIFSAASG